MGEILRRDDAWPTEDLHEQEQGQQDRQRTDHQDLVDSIPVILNSLAAIGPGKHDAPEDRTVRIRNFRSDKYKLNSDLIVNIEQEGDQFLACSYDTDQYGHGYSSEDAIQHLCSVLEDYYELLQEDRDSLSGPLQSHLRYLESILEKLE
jgi:hypothetical protein